MDFILPAGKITPSRWLLHRILCAVNAKKRLQVQSGQDCACRRKIDVEHKTDIVQGLLYWFGQKSQDGKGKRLEDGLRYWLAELEKADMSAQPE